MNPIRRLARLLLFLNLSILAHSAELPRVAVVPDSPEPSVAAFADLLSVSLASASSQYTLVERAELTRLASEAEIQKLAADQRPAALAKLAKADGLIIVGADQGDPKLPKLTLRLTSTNNGLVLRSLILGGKQDEYPKAAELAAGVLRFPCERLSHGDAKPPVIVSLLGIRPAFEIDRALETTLNLAVAQQLSAQSGIAVSERWKMNDLVFERSLANEKPSAFAIGTVLLDGSYTRKGDQLEFSLRLRKAESEEGKAFALQGPANKPVELAQQIAKLVAAESGQSGEVVTWNALEEAKQYSELGLWLLQRNQGRESAQAYETAMALGLVDGIVVRARIWAYQSILATAGKITPFQKEADALCQLSKQEFKGKVMNAIRMTQVSIDAIDANWGGVTLQEFSENDRDFILRQTFDINMKFLHALCMRREQHELSTEARILRGLSRDLVFKSEAALKNNFAGDVVQRFYMHDTPDAAEADLRNLLDPKNIGNEHWSKGRWIRFHFWETAHNPDLCRFVDWNSTDNRRGEEAWRLFVEKYQTSELFLQQLDGLAFAFQVSRGKEEKEQVLNTYLKILECNWNELLTPQGQMGFYVFIGFYSDKENRAKYPSFERRLTTLLTRIFESGKWVEPATIYMAYWATFSWNQKTPDGNPLVPDSLALPMLIAIENYIQRAKSDSRWQQQYQNQKYGDVENDLTMLPNKIMLACPQLKEQRVHALPAVPGAIPIQAWKPEIPGVADTKIWMDGNFMIAAGNSLLVPSRDHGIIDLDMRTMSIVRLIQPPLHDSPQIWGFAKNDSSLMINMDNRLFVTPLNSDGKAWVEVAIPDVENKDRLAWRIDGLGSEFFVGSSMMDDIGPKSPRMLAGKVRDGKLTWCASSNRRPEVNPIDKMDPRSARFALHTPAGKTLVVFEQFLGRTSIIELETGRQVFPLFSTGKDLSRGDMPLYWYFDDDEIIFLAAIDPGREQPRLLFKRETNHIDLPEIWNNVSPVYDSSSPEFRGQSISAIVYEGKLWLLKRDAVVHGKTEMDDPQAFRLVRMDLDGGKPVVIPLRYDVSEAIRKLGVDKKTSLERPIINYLSLTATPKGLFFSSSGIDYGRTFSRYKGIYVGGSQSPALLYITWDDINAWLAKNAPEAAKSALEHFK